MERGKTGKERFNELRYQMEKNSFVLSVIESRTAAVLHAESMGYDDTSTAMICRINAEYVKLIKAVKDQHPGSIEDIAQELYDRIYMQTGWKRDYSRFQLFDEELIERWFIVKEQERQLRAGNIDLDDFIATAKHAYWSKTGKDVDVIVREIEEKPEQLEQEEDEEDDVDLLDEFEVRLVRERLLCQMFKEGAIDEKTALKYMDALDLGHGAFLKIVEIHTGEIEPETEQEPNDEDEGAHTAEMIEDIKHKETQHELICRMFREGVIDEPTAIRYTGVDMTHESFMKLVEIYTDEEESETEEKDFDFFEYHKKETEAKLICKMYREGIIDEAVALEYLDEPDWSHDTLMRVVDNFAEKEEREDG